MRTAQFWNEAFREDKEAWNPDHNLQKAVDAATNHFGPLEGKRLIDLGCGRGATSLYFARLGATVISIDQSEVAISQLARYCQTQGIDTVEPIVGDVLDITRYAPVDFVFGSMILHHVDPFDEFPAALRQTLRAEGRCFFFENNASSKALMWFRDHVVGKFGIPKYGDSEEHPLTRRELDALRTYFDVRQVFPYLVYFHLMSVYLFRRRFNKICDWLDRVAYGIPALRRSSYRQYIYLT
jgi:SAM-dependent methyltransferase